MIRHAVISTLDGLFLTATMDLDKDLDHPIHSYVGLLKNLIKKVSTMAVKNSIPNQQTILAELYDFHYSMDLESRWIVICIADKKFPRVLLFDFLTTTLDEFKLKPESIKYQKRPYSLMKLGFNKIYLMILEPWLQSLKKHYSNPRIRSQTEINHVPIVSIEQYIPTKHKSMYPNQIRSFQLSKTWDIRFLITLQLVLFFVDGYFVAIAGLQIIRILRWNQHYKGLFDAIFNQLCILLLGLFSPIFIYMSFMTHLVIPFPKRMKSLIGFHTAVIFIQVLYTILFPKSSYHKPDHLENLTTLQRWATLFDSFSLPIPVIIIKLIHVVITVTRLTNHSNKVKNI